MTVLDRLIRRWRIHKARPFLVKGDRVLDIGCSDGILFRLIHGIHGIGVDPMLKKKSDIANVELIQGFYPENVPNDKIFDKICMLAVLEHIPIDKQSEIAKHCFYQLRPNGYLVITLPSPAVDRILDILTFFRLVDGIEFHQHYGLKPSMIPKVFEEVGFQLVKASKFQLGLNNLLVFRKPDMA